MNKSKFNVGDSVWIIDGLRVVRKQIEGVFPYRDKIMYAFIIDHTVVTYDCALGDSYSEQNVFSTKEELLKSL